MNKLGDIKIKAQSPSEAIIEIEGVIGMPEGWQFENSEQKITTYTKFKETIDEITTLEVDSVRVNIHSIGGNVEDAMLIYEALCSIKAKVETYCHGYVASAATIIAQAGACRYIAPGALYLIHNSTTLIDGNQQEAQRTATLLNKTDQQIAKIYAERAGRDVADFLELMGRDGGRGEWLSADEVIEHGLADKVVESSPIKNFNQRIRNIVKSFGLSLEKLVAEPSDENHDQSADVSATGKSPAITAIDIQSDREATTTAQAQMAIEPTQTLPREDPPIELTKNRGNSDAYAQDVELFRAAGL